MDGGKTSKPAKAPQIPRHRAIVMGSGAPVRPERSHEFCEALVEKCLDGVVCGHYDFVLGFAACFDAIARGTIDLDAPVDTALRAYEDVYDITTAPKKVCDIMRIGNE